MAPARCGGSFRAAEKKGGRPSGSWFQCAKQRGTTMHEKLDIYDLLGVLIPGVLMVCSVPLAFPAVSQGIGVVKFPDAFTVIGLTAASIFAGFLAQALASLVEPVLNFTWGGRLSERALSHGLGNRYFCKA